MPKALNIRWKILTVLMVLSIVPVLLLNHIYSDLTNQQVRSQLNLMADQAGHFVLNTLAHDQETLEQTLSLIARDGELQNAVDLLLLTGEVGPLQAIIADYGQQFELDRIELTTSAGPSYYIDLTIPDSSLAMVPTGSTPTEDLSNSSRREIRVAQGQLCLYSLVPLRGENRLIGNLIAYRQLDDRRLKHLQSAIRTDLALHDGRRVLAASHAELKGSDLDLQALISGGAASLPVRGQAHLVYNVPLPHSSAGLLIALDSSVISSANQRMAQILILTVIVIALVALGSGLYLSHKISRPLHSMAQNLREISAGGADLTQTLEVSTQDEIGSLAESFNQFAARLRDLVQRTRETTRELSTITGSIRSKFVDVNHGAAEQTKALEDSRQQMTEIGNTANEIADNISNLVASVQESAAATQELESTTRHIADQTEELFGIISDISSSIHQLSSSNEQVDDNIIELSKRAKETSYSVEQLEQATSAIETNAEQSSLLAQQAVTQAIEGKAAVQDTIRGISGLQQLIENTRLAVQELGTRSDAIGNIVDVIAEIADQTNLLALNAAIIAAQAGEHGQGFAVVADEIRNLAERTSVSTKEIAEIIENLQQGTAAAVNTIEAGSVCAQKEVARSHAAGEALEKLHQSSLHSTEQITGIAAETQKQAEENRKITQAVLGITSMLDQIANAIGQQTASTRSLSNAAESMKSIASRVKNSTLEQNRGSRQIAQSMEHIQATIEVIDTAAREQSNRSNQVVDSVARVSRIAESTAERAGDMDIVLEDLVEQTHELSQEMGSFKV